MTDLSRCSTVKLNREALIALRERSGMSKSDLGRAAGIDRTLVHRVENGERHATDDVIVKLAQGLKIPVTAIILDPSEAVA